MPRKMIPEERIKSEEEIIEEHFQQRPGEDADDCFDDEDDDGFDD